MSLLVVTADTESDFFGAVKLNSIFHHDEQKWVVFVLNIALNELGNSITNEQTF